MSDTSDKQSVVTDELRQMASDYWEYCNDDEMALSRLVEIPTLAASCFDLICEIDRLKLELTNKEQELQEAYEAIESANQAMADLLCKVLAGRDGPKKKTRILESLDQIAKHGGDAWSKIENPQALLDEIRGHEPQPDRPFKPFAPEEFVKKLRESGGDAWDKVNNQAELIGNEQPDGPITEELCRELGFVHRVHVHHSKREWWQCQIGHHRVTVEAFGADKYVRIDVEFIRGTCTANRLRNLVEAMRG